MIHNFVENLLKTQHTPTKERLTQPITHMEQFMAAHNQLKNGNVSVYRDQARRIFDEILGSKIKDRSMRATYDQAITDIIDSQVSHIGQITRSGFEQNAGRIASRRGIASISEHIQALASRTMLPGEATDDLIQAVADNARLSVRSSIDLANNVIGMNKKQFALGALGLAATAMFVGSEAPELSQDSLPTSTKSGILPPISDNKGYINKQPMGKSYQVRGSSDNTTSIRRDVSNFVGTPRANVRIVDKRDQRNK
jgi:hypothetical protein